MPESISPNRRLVGGILIVILLWAAFLRLWRCESWLPGLQVDEASNAWNAQCLLKTGTDEWGQRWPIFYTRAFDDYRSAVYLYALLPFQAIGGMNVCTTRLPAALGGIATIALVYYLGRKLFGTPTGLIAAAVMATSPWHVQYSRLGLEVALAPLMLSAALAVLLWAGIPCIDKPSDRPWKWRWIAALVAGALCGVTCYGYPALRLAFPITLFVAFAFTAPCWIRSIRDPIWRRQLLCIVAGFTLTFGPLVWKQLTDPNLTRRGVQSKVWSADDSLGTKIAKVAARYPPHFGPTFLFQVATTDPAFALPQGYGCFNWYVLPLLLAGVIALIKRFKISNSSRLLLAMLLTYPAGGLAFGYSDRTAPHELHSFHGVVALCLTAGLGASVGFAWLASYSRRFAYVAACAIATIALVSHIIYVTALFGPDFNNDQGKYWQRDVDLMQACQWLRPRLKQVDEVFITQRMIALPHAPTLVFLNYDPHDWFAQQRVYQPVPPGMVAETACTQVGKLHFMYFPQQTSSELEELKNNGKPDRVILILRPEQRAIAGASEPVLVIQHGDLVWLLVYEVEL